MAAGFLLGPVVMGALMPDAHARLFAPESLGMLSGLWQLGLVLFMFIVGAELRLPSGIPRQLLAASRIGVLSVVVPMALGLPMAALLYRPLAPANVALWPFALYMAVAVSITAFAVMARILKDRAMTHTTVGADPAGSGRSHCDSVLGREAADRARHPALRCRRQTSRCDARGAVDRYVRQRVRHRPARRARGVRRFRVRRLSAA